MSMSLQEVYAWYRNTLRNPKYRWWVVLATLAYLISPIDLIPDIFPIAGQIDDLMVLTLLLTEVTQMILEYAKRRNLGKTGTVESGEEQTVDVDAVSLEK